jgi:hypothetical protein
VRGDSYGSWGSQHGARAPSAMPLNKAAAGPKMNGYHGEGATGAVNGPLGRNDAVLYGRMPGGESQAHAGIWSAQAQMSMRHGGLGDVRMQGLPALQLPVGDDGLVEGMEAMQLGAGGGEAGMPRSQRPKLSDGERHEETEDDLFAMYRFKVRTSRRSCGASAVHSGAGGVGGARSLRTACAWCLRGAARPTLPRV